MSTIPCNVWVGRTKRVVTFACSAGRSPKRSHTHAVRVCCKHVQNALIVIEGRLGCNTRPELSSTAITWLVSVPEARQKQNTPWLRSTTEQSTLLNTLKMLVFWTIPCCYWATYTVPTRLDGGLKGGNCCYRFRTQRRQQLFNEDLTLQCIDNQMFNCFGICIGVTNN